MNMTRAVDASIHAVSPLLTCTSDLLRLPRVAAESPGRRFPRYCAFVSVPLNRIHNGGGETHRSARAARDRASCPSARARESDPARRGEIPRATAASAASGPLGGELAPPLVLAVQARIPSGAAAPRSTSFPPSPQITSAPGVPESLSLPRPAARRRRGCG